MVAVRRMARFGVRRGCLGVVVRLHSISCCLAVSGLRRQTSVDAPIALVLRRPSRTGSEAFLRRPTVVSGHSGS
jgi:hypothetical protein